MFDSSGLRSLRQTLPQIPLLTCIVSDFPEFQPFLDRKTRIGCSGHFPCPLFEPKPGGFFPWRSLQVGAWPRDAKCGGTTGRCEHISDDPVPDSASWQDFQGIWGLKFGVFWAPGRGSAGRSCHSRMEPRECPNIHRGIHQINRNNRIKTK